jgi:twitching motility protein PilT
MFDLQEALRFVVLREGSDLHLKANSPPIVRIHGLLQPLEPYGPMQAADTDRVLREMLTDLDKLAEFDRDHEVDFAYAVPGLARFRVNAFQQRGAVSIVARVIPFAVRTVQELGLPPVISEMAD